MTIPQSVRNRGPIAVVLISAVLLLIGSGGCSEVPEQGTIDTRAAGLKPQRVHGKGAPAAPEASKSPSGGR
jgi:hypothetical protein